MRLAPKQKLFLVLSHWGDGEPDCGQGGFNHTHRTHTHSFWPNSLDEPSGPSKAQYLPRESASRVGCVTLFEKRVSCCGMFAKVSTLVWCTRTLFLPYMGSDRLGAKIQCKSRTFLNKADACHSKNIKMAPERWLIGANMKEGFTLLSQTKSMNQILWLFCRGEACLCLQARPSDQTLLCFTALPRTSY